MKQHVRGIRCSIDYFDLAELLRFLVTKDWGFYISKCLLDGTISLQDITLSSNNITIFKDHCLWELELQCFPKGGMQMYVAEYKDFLESSCIFYLLYFDCGFLEIYLKESAVFRLFWDYLSALGAEDLSTITDENDKRTGFSV